MDETGAPMDETEVPDYMEMMAERKRSKALWKRQRSAAYMLWDAADLLPEERRRYLVTMKVSMGYDQEDAILDIVRAVSNQAWVEKRTWQKGIRMPTERQPEYEEMLFRRAVEATERHVTRYRNKVNVWADLTNFQHELLSYVGLEWCSPFVTIIICVAASFLILLAARRCVATFFDDGMLASPVDEGASNLAEWVTWPEGQEDEAAQGSWWANWFAQQRGKRPLTTTDAPYTRLPVADSLCTLLPTTGP